MLMPLCIKISNTNRITFHRHNIAIRIIFPTRSKCDDCKSCCNNNTNFFKIQFLSYLSSLFLLPITHGHITTTNSIISYFLAQTLTQPKSTSSASLRIIKMPSPSGTSVAVKFGLFSVAANNLCKPR